MAAAALIGLLAARGVAAKNDDGDADARIQTMTVELKKLEVGDPRKAATAEIGQAEALRDKARTIIGERKQREVLTQTLDELEATIALAAAKIVQAEHQATHDAEVAKLAQAKRDLDEARARVAGVEKEQAELDKKLGGGK